MTGSHMRAGRAKKRWERGEDLHPQVISLSRGGGQGGIYSVPKKELLEFRPLSFLLALASFPLRNPHI